METIVKDTDTVGVEDTDYNGTTYINWEELELAYQELKCGQEYTNFTREEGVTYCNSTFDSVTCWPPTPAGQDAVMPCPREYGGVELLRANVTKHCFHNGSWAQKAVYDLCFPPPSEKDIHVWITTAIFYTGYTISTMALLLALFIFWYFKTLRCRRNLIHCHLMVTFVFKNVLWLLMFIAFLKFVSAEFTDEREMSETTTWTCRLLVTGYNYLQVASFCWMFVEGLYLHTMIVWAFSADKVRFWIYALLGWGVPVPIIMIWGIVKVTVDNDSCWLPGSAETNPHDYVYIAPVLLVLLINIIFLASIEIVLITKLRSANGGCVSQEQRQYKRAVKGTVILFPLLGLIYVLCITPPGNNHISQLVYVYVNSTLQSFQGLLVALFYCFLNTEVRHTVQKRFWRWKERRSVTSTYSRGSRGLSIHKTDGNLLLRTNQSSPTNENGRIMSVRKANGKQANGVTEMSYIQDFETSCLKENSTAKDVAL